MSRLFYILKKNKQKKNQQKRSLIFAYDATAITQRVTGCIDAKKISPDFPSGNFQENMHSFRKVYFCVEKLHFLFTSSCPHTSISGAPTDRGGRVSGWACSPAGFWNPPLRGLVHAAGTGCASSGLVRDPIPHLHPPLAAPSSFLESRRAPLLSSWS